MVNRELHQSCCGRDTSDLSPQDNYMSHLVLFNSGLLPFELCFSKSLYTGIDTTIEFSLSIESCFFPIVICFLRAYKQEVTDLSILFTRGQAVARNLS